MDAINAKIAINAITAINATHAINAKIIKIICQIRSKNSRHLVIL